MKKFAFLLMDAQYDPDRHRAEFSTGDMETFIFTVRSLNEAKTLVKRLCREGFGAIELCGAFGCKGAAELARLTDNKVAVGYVTHDPSMDKLFSAFFGE